MDARKAVSGLWILAAVNGGAEAAPCAGFTDVDSTSVFCHSVEWLKNRKITTGCAPTLYCPDDKVSRLELAAFLSRLSVALAPVYLTASEAGISSAVNNNDIVCQTSTYYLEEFPRVVTANATLYHSAPTLLSVTGKLVIGNGEFWSDLSNHRSIASNPAGGHATQSLVAGPYAVDHRTFVQFGIQTSVLGSPSTNDAGCALNVTLDNLTLPPPSIK